MKMALNVLSAPALWTGYTLILLIIVDGSKGESISEMLVAGTDGGIIGNLVTLLKSIDNRFKIIEETVVKNSYTVGIIETKITETLEKVEPIAAIEKVVNETSNNVDSIENTVNAVHDKVKSIDEIVDRCPRSDGFFVAPGTGGNQCLKVITGKMTWDASVTACQTEGAGKNYTVELARPHNALELRHYLFEEYSQWDFWVNARGDGSQILWKTTGVGSSKNVQLNNPLWIPAPTGSRVSPQSCMVLAASPALIKKEPQYAYFTQQCTDKQHAICELFPATKSINIRERN